MGFGTTLRTNLYFSHKTYKTKYEVYDEIELKESIIRNCETEIMMFMTMTEPAKFWKESEAEVGETPLIWMQNEIKQNLESIKESTSELAFLYKLYYAWDNCHNDEEKAIEPFKGEKLDDYMWGDYIESVYPNGEDANVIL